jgi:DNA-binding CsgD family transcriptional regulator
LEKKMTNVHEFSEVVSALNAAAQAKSASDFAAEAADALRRLINFDKIAFGIEGRSIAPGTCVAQQQTCRYRRVRGRVRRWNIPVKPVILNRAIDDGGQHVAAVTWLVEGTRADRRNEEMSAPHGVRQTLFHIDRSHAGQVGNWMAVIKRVNDGFDDQNVLLLRAVWPHVLRAFRANLARQLDINDTRHEQRSLALISRRGKVSVADKRFQALFNKEWPEVNGRSLPPLAMFDLLGKRSFEGKAISIVVKQQIGQDILVCEAVSLSILHTLGPAERVVAHSLKEGLGYKEIALKMGTSPNTVRTQISRIYKKLEVHDKSALAKLLAAA